MPDPDESAESLSQQRPYPPFELATRVSSLPAGDEQQALDWYEWLGAFTSQKLIELGPGSNSLKGQKWLDFGCGAGRTMRQLLAEAEEVEIWGTDIDELSITWLNENLCPPLNALTCGVEPPLPFESDSFDFIWAISVFTHLADNSADWLLELHRILRPGGLLMASYMGEINSEEIAGEPWDENRIGMNVLSRHQSWDDGGPSVLMSDWWVREHWGRAFEIESVTPGILNQSWPMMRKREVEITAEELLAPGDDPREWAALRHNLLQAQREAEAQSGRGIALAEGEETIRAEYEDSLSWRITRPLRWLSRAVSRRRRPGP